MKAILLSRASHRAPLASNSERCLRLLSLLGKARGARAGLLPRIQYTLPCYNITLPKTPANLSLSGREYKRPRPSPKILPASAPIRTCNILKCARLRACNMRSACDFASQRASIPANSSPTRFRSSRNVSGDPCRLLPAIPDDAPRPPPIARRSFRPSAGDPRRCFRRSPPIPPMMPEIEPAGVEAIEPDRGARASRLTRPDPRGSRRACASRRSLAARGDGGLRGWWGPPRSAHVETAAGGLLCAEAGAIASACVERIELASACVEAVQLAEAIELIERGPWAWHWARAGSETAVREARKRGRGQPRDDIKCPERRRRHRERGGH
jgi:hypothetical protein